MTVFFLIIYVTYILLVVVLIVGWERTSRRTITNHVVTDQRISIVVAARNEEDTITRLLESLCSQSYDNFEIIVVDDHSTDGTARSVNEMIEKGCGKLRIVKPSFGAGKKNAITTGVAHAYGDIIVTTDADCLAPTGWLRCIQHYFQQQDVKMVFGGVRIARSDNFFVRLQSLEFCSLIGAGAATLFLGFPSMANGANLAFRKEVFDEVGGFEGNAHISSGDDEFLLRKVFDKYTDGIRFMTGKESVVTTFGLHRLVDFIDQRVRWAGKWRAHKGLSSKALALFVFLFHATTLLLFYSLAMNLLPLYLGFSMLGVKAVVEHWYLKRVSRYLDVPWRWTTFLSLQLLHSLYVVSIAILAQKHESRWKGRNVRISEKLTTSDQYRP